MPLQVEKKERETAQGLVRRFSKAIKRSGILKEVRRRRFSQRPLSDASKKKTALRRIRAGEEYERKEKLGLNKNRFPRFTRS